MLIGHSKGSQNPLTKLTVLSLMPLLDSRIKTRRKILVLSELLKELSDDGFLRYEILTI